MFVMACMTLLLWAGFFWTVYAINPLQTNWIGHVLFYFTLFLALLGTFSLIGIFLRRKWVHEQALYRLVTLAVRQSVAMSIFFLITLFLQGQRLLRWWILLGLFAVVFGLEMTQLLRERRLSTHTQTIDQESPSAGYEPIFERKQIPPLPQAEGEPSFIAQSVSDSEL